MCSNKMVQLNSNSLKPKFNDRHQKMVCAKCNHSESRYRMCVDTFGLNENRYDYH